MSLDILKANGMDFSQGNSCFVGPVGTGKTTCLSTLARNYGARTVTFQEVNRLFGQEGHKATWTILKAHPHLFLDDVQIAPIKSWGTDIESPYELLLRTRLDEILEAKARINEIQLEVDEIDGKFLKNKYQPHPLYPVSGFFTEKESYECHREWLLSKMKEWTPKGNSRVFFTTNIKVEDFSLIFSAPLIDRIFSEMKIVFFTGESKREYIN